MGVVDFGLYDSGCPVLTVLEIGGPTPSDYVIMMQIEASVYGALIRP